MKTAGAAWNIAMTPMNLLGDTFQAQQDRKSLSDGVGQIFSGAGHVLGGIGQIPVVRQIGQTSLWATNEMVKRPFGTLDLTLADSFNKGFSNFFRGDTWRQAYDDTRYVSAGQAHMFSAVSAGQWLDRALGSDYNPQDPGQYAAFRKRMDPWGLGFLARGAQGLDPRTDKGRKQYEDNFALKASSGGLDAMVTLIADPTRGVGAVARAGKLKYWSGQMGAAATSKLLTGDGNWQKFTSAATFQRTADFVRNAKSEEQVRKTLFNNHTNGGVMAALLFDTRNDPDLYNLTWRALYGDAEAWGDLTKQAPRIADTVGSKVANYSISQTAKNYGVGNQVLDDAAKSVAETKTEAFVDAMATDHGIYGRLGEGVKAGGLLTGQAVPRLRLSSTWRVGVNQFLNYGATTAMGDWKVLPFSNYTVSSMVRTLLPSSRGGRMLDLNNPDSLRVFRNNLLQSRMPADQVDQFLSQYARASTAASRFNVVSNAENAALKVHATAHGIDPAAITDSFLSDLNQFRSYNRQFVRNNRVFLSDQARRLSQKYAVQGLDDRARALTGLADDLDAAVQRGSYPNGHIGLPDQDGNLALIPLDQTTAGTGNAPALLSQFEDNHILQDWGALDSALWWKNKGPLGNGIWKSKEAATALAELVIGVWKVSAIMRPGYIWRTYSDEIGGPLAVMGSHRVAAAATEGAKNAFWNMINRGVLAPQAVRDAVAREKAGRLAMRGQRPGLVAKVDDRAPAAGSELQKSGVDPAVSGYSFGAKGYQSYDHALADGVVSVDAFIGRLFDHGGVGTLPEAYQALHDAYRSGRLSKGELQKHAIDEALSNAGRDVYQSTAWQQSLIQTAIDERKNKPQGVPGSPILVDPFSGASPKISVPKPVPPAATLKPAVPEASDPIAQAIANLGQAGSRQEATAALAGLTVAQLKTVAASLREGGITVPGRPTKANFSRAITEFSTGRRLDYEAVERVVYPSGAKPRQVTPAAPAVEPAAPAMEPPLSTTTAPVSVEPVATSGAHFTIGSTTRIPADLSRFDDVYQFIHANADELLMPSRLLHAYIQPDGNLALSVARYKGDEVLDALKPGSGQRLNVNWGQTKGRPLRASGLIGHDIRTGPGEDDYIHVLGAFEGQYGDRFRKQVSSKGTSDAWMDRVSNRNHARLMAMSGQQWQNVDASMKGYETSWERAAMQLGADRAAQQFLRGKSMNDVVAWMHNTDAGRAYQAQLGPYVGDYYNHIAQVAGMVDTYLPVNVDRQAASAELRRKTLDGSVRFADLEQVVDRASMPQVHGASLDFATGGGYFGAKIRQWTNGIFSKISDMPLDHFARYPFAADRFNYYRDQLVASRGLWAKGEAFTQSDVDAVERLAHERALVDVRKYLYDSMAQSDLAKGLRLAVPFGSALYDSAAKWGVVFRENPFRAGGVWAVWSAPDRAGMVQDNEGAHLEIRNGQERWYTLDPQTGKRTDLPDNYRPSGKNIVFRLPVGTPTIDGARMNITINKGNLQTFLDMPTFGPMVAIPANKFALSHPEFASNKFVQTFILPFGPSSNSALSAVPGNVRNWKDLWDNWLFERDTQQSENYAMAIYATEMTNFSQGKRGAAPTFEEARSKAAQIAGLRFLSRWAGSTAQFTSPYQPYVDYYHMLAGKPRKPGDPSADEEFYNTMGPEFFWLTTSVTKNALGIPATLQSDQAYKKYADLMEQFPDLASLIEGSEGAGVFNKAVYEAQKATPLRYGSGKNQRELVPLEQAIADTQRRQGWIEFGQLSDAIHADMVDRGLTSLQQKGAKDLVAAKSQWLQEHQYWTDPYGAVQISPWFKDYSTTDSSKIESRLGQMRQIVQDTRLQGRDDIRGLIDYLDARDGFKSYMDSYGYKDLSSKKAAPLQRQWNSFVFGLKDSNLGFAALYDRWLSNDATLKAA